MVPGCHLSVSCNLYIILALCRPNINAPIDTTKKEGYHPYRTRIFWLVFLVTFGLTVVGVGSLYSFISRSILHQTQQNLEAIAVQTAAKIPVDVHEQLVHPEDQQSPGYKQIEAFFSRSWRATQTSTISILSDRPPVHT